MRISRVVAWVLTATIAVTIGFTALAIRAAQQAGSDEAAMNVADLGKEDRDRLEQGLEGMVADVDPAEGVVSAESARDSAIRAFWDSGEPSVPRASLIIVTSGPNLEAGPLGGRPLWVLRYAVEGQQARDGTPIPYIYLFLDATTGEFIGAHLFSP